jgi:DNA-binding NtrC family response regulator
VYQLRILRPRELARVERLDRPVLTVGSDRANTIVLPAGEATRLSRVHALLRVEDDSVQVVDLGSTNGSAVEREALEPYRPRKLQPEEILYLGNVLATIEPCPDLAAAETASSTAPAKPEEVAELERELGVLRREVELRRKLRRGSAMEIAAAADFALGELLRLAGAERGLLVLWEDEILVARPAWFREELRLAEVRRVLAGLDGLQRPETGPARFAAEADAAGSARSFVVPLRASAGAGYGLLYLGCSDPSLLRRWQAESEAFLALAAVVVDELLEDPGRRPRLTPSLRERVRAWLCWWCPEMEVMVEQALRWAVEPAPVLLLGESGTGKENLARLIHEFGPRHGGPFVAVNCAAFAHTLLESELFGHEKGAFSGAGQQHRGAFEQAHGGVLFLDEIGETSLAMQAKLLRVLERPAFRRVGGEKEIEVDVKIVAATNQDLTALMDQGRFRRDLYFRVNKRTLKVPPLRERGEDVLGLFEYFWSLTKSGSPKVCPPQLTEDAKKALLAYPWPGNVRELQNEVGRLASSLDGPRVRLADLSCDIREQASGPAEDLDLRERMTRFKRELLIGALRGTGGNRKAAAAALGMPLSTFFRWQKEAALQGWHPRDEPA